MPFILRLQIKYLKLSLTILKTDKGRITHRYHSGQRHKNDTGILAVSPHTGAGIALWGAPGDIWLQLQEAQMCHFDGKETCQLSTPALTEKTHTRRDQSHRWEVTVLFFFFSQTQSGVQMKTLDGVSRGLEGGVLRAPIELLWRIIDCGRRNKKRGNK